MPGDITLEGQGRDVQALLVEDANGYIAQRGEAVEVVGETPEQTEIALCQTAGKAVGTLHDVPTSFDDDYGDPDGTGMAVVRLANGPLDWFPLADGWDQTVADPTTTSAAAGDFSVVGAGGGLQQYNGQTAGPLGIVWATNPLNEMYRNGKAAVYRFR